MSLLLTCGMKKIFSSVFCSFILFTVPAQQVQTPDRVYGILFTEVQMSRIFPDGKTFVDCRPKRDPKAIVSDYTKLKKEAKKKKVEIDLKKFVEENFDAPKKPADNYHTDVNEDVATHIKKLWAVLKRSPDEPVAGSSLLALPHSYIVPGGRFREIYYWDSYFTMLGLQESGEHEMMENMIKNFAHLINTYGHIPNGNRSYYLSRSQPPFFSLMIELLADIKGEDVYGIYLPALEKEYQFWMDGSDKLKTAGVYRRVIRFADGSVLNRYWDDADVPRQESYREDVEAAEKSGRDKVEMYRHLRAAAESGIDFSSRWFADDKNIASIETADMITVDLNALLYNLEKVIAKAYSVMAAKEKDISKSAVYSSQAAKYTAGGEKRKKAIDQYCWNDNTGYYCDYNYVKNRKEDNLTLAAMYPLFFNIADRAKVNRQVPLVLSNLLKRGGLLTTIHNTGQQWDAPNGWAPLQWMSIIGLERYGFYEEAKDIAQRWIKLNTDVYKRTGKLMEKYNVADTDLEAGGGEYQSQDGFGWTNGVLLKLMSLYNK
ncbi:MAG: alpha,alpha-trehalase TreF [Chitinophagaceae bacterium]|nr:alpha,alpha-trehalase TreF [Chitinophagaceae bacterium]